MQLYQKALPFYAFLGFQPIPSLVTPDFKDLVCITTTKNRAKCII